MEVSITNVEQQCIGKGQTRPATLSPTELVVKRHSAPCQTLPEQASLAEDLGGIMSNSECFTDGKDWYSMNDIRHYFESINITPETVVENFRHFLSETVHKRICELDNVVVEITPPVTNNISTTSNLSTNSHSSYTKTRVSSNYMNRKSSHSDHRKRHGDNNHNNSNTEDWNSGKSFKPTKIMSKEGVEKDINDIRISLNKISNKNYETHRDLIVSLVEKFMEYALDRGQNGKGAESLLTTNSGGDLRSLKPAKRVSSYFANPDEFADALLTQEVAYGHLKSLEKEENVDAISNIKKISQFIFDIASTNKFYGNIYADLYKELVEKFEIFTIILNDFVSNYNHNIYTLQYVDSNVDYDAYCEYNKANEIRRATASFLVLLMNRSVLKTSTLTDLIIHFQSVFTKYISEENRTNEADEITEVLFLLITLGAEILSQLPEWESTIIPNIIITSKLKAKEQKSMSSRSVFKYMDLLKKIGR